jgi:hypothetical protein
VNSIDDFDFLFGRWAVRHRRLRQRGCGCSDWDELEGAAETRPLLGKLCNIEEHLIEGGGCSGIALRTFVPAASLWFIYWVSVRDGVLQPPVSGRFDGPLGRFEGEDLDGSRPIRVRFLWDRTDADEPRWEQSFSYDAGRTWELNWTMHFTRQT